MNITSGCKKLDNMRVYGASELLKISIQWYSEPDKYYTIIIYEESNNYINTIVGNILGNDTNNSTKIYQYLPPGKENTENNQPFNVYIAQIYVQKNYTSFDIDSSDRNNFSVQDFVLYYNLDIIDELKIMYNSIDKTFYTVNSGYFNIIRKDSLLDPNEKMYCQRLISHAEKQPGLCNFQKAWFTDKKSSIENPFATIEKEIGISTDQCPYNYDYDKMSQKQLIAFCNIYNVDIKDDDDKNNIIKKIGIKYKR